jgi:putative ABC transport system permease protein
MVMALNNRIRRVFLEHRGQFLGSIAIVILSSLAFTSMTHFASNFERLANEFQGGYAQEDATFTTDRRIADLRELESAANAIIEEGRSLDYRLEDGNTLRIFSRNERVNLPAIVEGEALSSGRILLNPPVFGAGDSYRIGDELRILDRSFTVSGFAALPNYIYPLQSEVDMMPRPGFGVAVITKEDFAALGQGSSFYAVKFNDAGQNPRARFPQLRELLKTRGIEITQWTGIDDNKRVNIVAAEVEIIGLVSRAVPTALLLLASFMVASVVGRMISRESAIAGALYALGYRRSEIYRHYLMFPVLIAIAGGITGTALGMLPVHYLVSFILTAFPMPLTGIEFNPTLLILSLLLPLLFLAGSGYYVIWKELRHSPVELMRGKKERYKVNFLERALPLERLSFSMKFQVREQLRSLSRLAFLLIGVAVATVLLQWAFSLKGSVDYMLTGGVTSVYDFEYEYKFDALRTEPLPAGAEPYAAGLFLPVGDDKRDFYVSGVLPGSAMLKLVDESGTSLSTDKVIMTKAVARLLGAKAGDTVDIARKLDGEVFSLRIDAVADTYSGKFVFMPLSEFNSKFGMPEGSYNGAFSNVLLDIPANQSYSMVSIEEKMAGAQETMAPVQSMVGFYAAIAFVIGVIVIYVVTSLIVEENRQVISLMKILGYRKKEINSLVLNSSRITVVVGYLIGIPMTTAAIGALIQSLETSVGMVVPPARVDLPFLALGFVVVMLAFELSKLLSRKKVNAVPMSEALKATME